MLLGILWLPVIPLGAYLLARRLTGRTDVALIAAALTAFAGGFDVSLDRLWVNSMFMVGQVVYPIYPRDLVFGLLPFAMLAFLRAADGGRGAGWAGRPWPACCSASVASSRCSSCCRSRSPSRPGPGGGVAGPGAEAGWAPWS